MNLFLIEDSVGEPTMESEPVIESFPVIRGDADHGVIEDIALSHAFN